VAVAGSGVFVATAGSLLVAVLLIDSVVLAALLVSTHLLRIKDEAPAPAQ
jgi:hypothetical protein